MMAEVPGALDRGTATPDERSALLESLCVVLWAMNKAGMINAAIRLTDAPPAPFGRGAKGPLVAVWQKVVGATPDGSFGPDTERKTETWSTAAGFGPRKIVEPAMWATAIGLTFRFEGSSVILPGGAKIDAGAATADAQRVLGGGE